MYPIDETELNIEVETEEKTARIERSLRFDYETKNFNIVDGALAECTGVEAVKQWVELLIRTNPGKYAIYDENFGVSTDELIGYKSIPLGFIYSELKREIQEGLAKNPAIDSIDNYSATRENGALTISFTVYLKDGASGEVRVNV